MKRAETAVAVVITLAVMALHVVRLLHAGALWRDEAGAVEIAQLPTLGEIHARFPHEAFPLVFPVTLRTYIALAGDGDLALRLFGTLVGLAIVGALWLNARAAGGLPLISLALLGFHPYFLFFGDSLRGYGLGILLILLTFGAFSRLVARPGWRTAAVAALPALLSVHCLLHNSAMLLGLGAAATVVGVVRGRWRVTAAALGIGSVAALSLLPYHGPLAAARQWDVLLIQEIGPEKILHRSLDAFSSPHRLTAWIWFLLIVTAAVLVRRDRAAAGTDGDDGRSASDVRLFQLLTIPLAMAAQYGFFTVEELWPRYGSFPGFNPIVELSLTFHNLVVGANGQRQAMFLENVSGLAERILRNFDVKPPDSALVISSSGCNIVPIEMAELFRQRGIKVVAIVSRRHSEATASNHADGKRLQEVADLTLDTGAPPGDAMVTIDGLDTPVAPGSTIGGCLLVNMIKAEVAERLTRAGQPPTVLSGACVVGAKRAKELFEAAYDEHARRLAELYQNLGKTP